MSNNLLAIVESVEENLFALIFFSIAWIASVQGARLLPHGIKTVKWPTQCVVHYVYPITLIISEN